MVAPVVDLDADHLIDANDLAVQIHALQHVHVAVVGGSIGGLATALALCKLGCKVNVGGQSAW